MRRHVWHLHNGYPYVWRWRMADMLLRAAIRLMPSGHFPREEAQKWRETWEHKWFRRPTLT